MNQFIRFCKALVLIALLVAVFLYWRQFGDLQSGVLLAFLAVSAIGWGLLVYLFASCYFEKQMIQTKLEKAKGGLGEIANATIKAYHPSRRGNYITFRFRSDGVPAEAWEAKRAAVQSALNYTILGRIESGPNDWGLVVFRARRGRPQANKEVLDDGDLL